MAQADIDSTPHPPTEHRPGASRRGILAGVAASLAAGAALNAAALVKVHGTEPDPILALIEAHRRASALFEEVVHRLGKLDEVIPSERRKNYHVEHRGTDVGKNDDPCWTATQNEYWTKSDAEDELACELLHAEVTTIAGAVALLRYANEYVDAGNEWPDDLTDDSRRRWRRERLVLVSEQKSRRCAGGDRRRRLTTTASVGSIPRRPTKPAGL
jgi:hypothetical protein